MWGRRTSVLVAISSILAACGGKAKAPAPAPIVHVAPKPPPPPVCVKAGEQQSAIGSAGVDDHGTHFCVSDGTDANQCFTMALPAGTLGKASAPGAAQAPALTDSAARVETTATEVKVCALADNTCKTIKPGVGKAATNPIEAAVNAAGTIVVALVGDGAKGKGAAEVWDVAKGKKLATIKYAKGEFKCGHARVLGDTVFVSADVCEGPAAQGALYTTKGKKLADAGGKSFGTYGTEPVQVKGDTWAFLEETGGAIALQDVKTGKVVKTIDVGTVWAQEVADAAPPADDAAPPPNEGEGEKNAKKPAESTVEIDGKVAKPSPAEKAAAGAPPMGNPGESALVRGADGKLLVITGGPSPGNVAIVDVDSGEAQIVHAKACK